MKQVLQWLNDGRTEVVDVPVPQAHGRHILVRTHATLVSSGTERSIVEFGRASVLGKLSQQRDRLGQVLAKAQTEGVMPTVAAVRARLASPLTPGYCHAGVVVDAGTDDGPFRRGDRVATNGCHAEFVQVPYNLAARIPDGVTFEAAAFAPLAAVGLNGIRLAEVTIGASVAVYGLGLVGLLTVQLLRAAGCRVIGIDRVATRLALAQRFGAEVVDATGVDVASQVLARTGGWGADAVLLTLSAESSDPTMAAAAMARKKGRLVLVGVSGLELKRDEFYRKELTFAVACSYGPGRYDPTYEEQGHDYPLPFVRWTAQRNFEAVLGQMASGRLDPLPLVSHRFALAEAPRAYDLIQSSEPSLGVLLLCPDAPEPVVTRVLTRAPAPSTPVARDLTVGVAGAGAFATHTLLPLLAAEGFRLRSICSRGGTDAALAARRFGFERVTTDFDELLADDLVGTICVLTRHDSHAPLALRALRAGKHVYVEKPLALRQADVAALGAAAQESGRLLVVGFNRRFAPLALRVRAEAARRSGPAVVLATIHAGAVPSGHWVLGPAGGGRVVGEACHWVDLARALVGRPIVDVQVVAGRPPGTAMLDPTVHLALRFEDESTAAIQYVTTGSRFVPKERIECSFDGSTFSIDNWRRLRRFGPLSGIHLPARRPDKGQRNMVRALRAALEGSAPYPVQLDEVLEVSMWSVRAGISAAAGGARGGDRE